MADLCRSYIDSCCYIDMVKTEVGKALLEPRERNVWFLKRLLEAHRDREVDPFTSTLTIAECSHGGDGDISKTVKSAFTRLLMSGQYVKLVQLTPFIAVDARDLRWNHGLTLRGADAVHVASALAMKCVEFLTSDSRFDRLNQLSGALSKIGLAVRNGRDTTCLPSKYRQEKLELPSAPTTH
jgi:predicted nucleic acid-binding protein